MNGKSNNKPPAKQGAKPTMSMRPPTAMSLIEIAQRKEREREANPNALSTAEKLRAADDWTMKPLVNSIADVQKEKVSANPMNGGIESASAAILGETEVVPPPAVEKVAAEPVAAPAVPVVKEEPIKPIVKPVEPPAPTAAELADDDGVIADPEPAQDVLQVKKRGPGRPKTQPRTAFNGLRELPPLTGDEKMALYTNRIPEEVLEAIQFFGKTSLHDNITSVIAEGLRREVNRRVRERKAQIEEMLREGRGE